MHSLFRRIEQNDPIQGQGSEARSGLRVSRLVHLSRSSSRRHTALRRRGGSRRRRPTTAHRDHSRYRHSIQWQIRRNFRTAEGCHAPLGSQSDRFAGSDVQNVQIEQRRSRNRLSSRRPGFHHQEIQASSHRFRFRSGVRQVREAWSFESPGDPCGLHRHDTSASCRLIHPVRQVEERRRGCGCRTPPPHPASSRRTHLGSRGNEPPSHNRRREGPNCRVSHSRQGLCKRRISAKVDLIHTCPPTVRSLSQKIPLNRSWGR